MPRKDSEPTDMEAAAWDLVGTLINSGGILAGIWESVLQDMDAETFPGERLDAVLLEMMVGSSLAVLRKAGPNECRRATLLIQSIHDRVKGDLRLAVDIAERRV